MIASDFDRRPDVPADPGSTRRQALIGAALLAAAGLAFARTPRERLTPLGKSKLDDGMPERIGGWRFQTSSGFVLPPVDQLRDKIYSQLLTRLYTRRDGQSVMLLIAYSARQDGTVQVHRPEVCYPASGYRLLHSEPFSLHLPARTEVPSRFMVAEGQFRNEDLIYWTRVGDYYPTTWSGEHVAVMRERLAGTIPDGMLVRVSTQGGGADSRALLSEFAGEMVNAASPRLRRALIGAA